MHLCLDKDLAIDLITDLQGQFTETAEGCWGKLLREGDMNNYFVCCNNRRASGLERRGGYVVHVCSVFVSLCVKNKSCCSESIIIEERQLTKSFSGT